MKAYIGCASRVVGWVTGGRISLTPLEMEKFRIRREKVTTWTELEIHAIPMFLTILNGKEGPQVMR